MKLGRFVFGLAVTLLAICPLGSSIAHAESPQSLSIGPSAVHQILQPGSTSSGTLQVTNVGQLPFTFQFYASPYSVANYIYSPIFTPVPGRPDASSWLHFSVSGGNLLPSQASILKYTINVPRNVAPGGYYAVGFAQTESPTSNPGLKVKERVGCIFYLQIAGPAKEVGSVDGWKTSFLQSSPPRSSFLVEDQGSVDYVSHITLTLRDILNHPKETYQTEKIVLPQTIRQVNVRWSNVPAVALLKVGGTASVFGRNQELPVRYVLVVSQTTRLIMLAVIILIIVATGLRYILRLRAGIKKAG